MRRLSVDAGPFFQQSIEIYKVGFGKLYDNFWLGLEYVHRITNAYPTAVGFDTIALKTFLPGAYKEITEQVYNFTLKGESEGYSMQVNDQCKLLFLK